MLFLFTEYGERPREADLCHRGADLCHQSTTADLRRGRGCRPRLGDPRPRVLRLRTTNLCPQSQRLDILSRLRCPSGPVSLELLGPQVDVDTEEQAETRRSESQGVTLQESERRLSANHGVSQ